MLVALFCEGGELKGRPPPEGASKLLSLQLDFLDCNCVPHPFPQFCFRDATNMMLYREWSPAPS